PVGYTLSLHDALPICRRVVNGNVGLRIPARVVRAKCLPYMKGENPIHRPERIRDSEFAIVEEYQSEYRGIVNYYRMAHNLASIRSEEHTSELQSPYDL